MHIIKTVLEKKNKAYDYIKIFIVKGGCIVESIYEDGNMEVDFFTSVN